MPQASTPIGTNEEHNVNLKLHITLFDCIGGVPPQLALVPSEKGSADREHQTERDPTVRLATGPALGRRSWRDASRPHRSTLAGTGTRTGTRVRDVPADA